MTLAHLAMVRAATDAEARGIGAARTKAGLKDGKRKQTDLLF